MIKTEDNMMKKIQIIPKLFRLLYYYIIPFTVKLHLDFKHNVTWNESNTVMHRLSLGRQGCFDSEGLFIRK